MREKAGLGVLSLTLFFMGCADRSVQRAPLAQQDERPVQTAPLAQQNEQVSAHPDFAVFLENLDNYVKLRSSLGDKAIKQPKEDPERVLRQMDELRAKLATARKDAKQGTLITPEAASAIKGILRSEFRGADGKMARLTVMAENPGKIPCNINDKYPEEAPVATIPPELLVRLPKLPDDIEYRFVGRDLILRDARANIVIDCLPGAIS